MTLETFAMDQKLKSEGFIVWVTITADSVLVFLMIYSTRSWR